MSDVPWGFGEPVPSSGSWGWGLPFVHLWTTGLSQGSPPSRVNCISEWQCCCHGSRQHLVESRCAGHFPELGGHRGAWTRRGLATQPCSSIPPTCCRCILSAQSPDLPCAHSSRAGGCAAPRHAPRVLSSAFGYDPRRISEQICANSFIVRDGLSMGEGFDFYFHTFVFLSVVSIKDEC